MTKPEMTCEIAIDFTGESQRCIYFYSTPDAAQDLSQFGDVEPGPYKNHYKIIVDARFRFGDVLAYIAQYEQVETQQVTA